WRRWVGQESQRQHNEIPTLPWGNRWAMSQPESRAIVGRRQAAWGGPLFAGSQIATPSRASSTVSPVRQSVTLLLEKSLRASADPRSPKRQGPLLRVAAVPRMVMAQSGVQANGLAKQPLPPGAPPGAPLADLPVSPPQRSPARKGFLEC